MNTFKAALQEELVQSLVNNFGIENYDQHRFGKWTPERSVSLLNYLKRVIKRVTGYKGSKKSVNEFLARSFNKVEKYEDGLEYFYRHLDQEGKNLIVKLIAYQLLGYRKVKLPRNNPKYWESLNLVSSLKDSSDTYDPNFMHLILEKFDLNPIGYDVRLYFNALGVAIDYGIEQYAYKSGDKNVVYVEKGDVVLDLGGCWGDTALYFASLVGENGRVYSFEFIPNNIRLFNINTSLNPALVDQIELIPNPVSNVSGNTIYYKDNGPGSNIKLEPFEGQTGTTTTISIDDFVKKSNITSVDFIKMDIEGAEPMALKGAIETIRKFRPKLAIAIYHSLDDFVNIPRWILELNLGYELFVDHFTIHAEETICFAKPKDR